MKSFQTLAALFLVLMPFYFYSVRCNSDWKLRTEYVHSVELPSSAIVVENDGWGTPDELFSPIKSTMIIDRDDLCRLLTALDAHCTQLDADSMWVVGHSAGNGSAAGWFGLDSGYVGFKRLALHQDHTVVRWRTIDEEHLFVELIGMWN